MEAYTSHLVECIENDLVDKFAEALYDWDDQSMNREQDNDLIILLVTKMEEYESAGTLKELVSFMTDEGVGYTFISILFAYQLSKKCLQYVAEVFELDYFILVREVLSLPWRGEGKLEMTIANIKTAYGDDIPLITAKELLTISTKLNNHLMATYLRSVIDSVDTPFAPIPEWMLDSDGKTHDELVAELDVERPRDWISESIEKDAEYICHISGKDVDLDELYDDLIDKFSDMTTEERQQFISKVIWYNDLMLLADRADIFRVFGFCLPTPGVNNLNIRSRDPCDLWGGCRSMLCWHHENYDTETGDKICLDPIEENRLNDLWWFTGKCDECRLKILKECYAVRMPIESGGFVGCYCSFDCIRHRAQSFDTNVEILHEKYEGPELITRFNQNRLYLVDRIEGIYKKFGIWDRESD
jgi:GTPase SAR1 family protein